MAVLLPSAVLAQSQDLPHFPTDPRDKFETTPTDPSPNRLSPPMGHIPLRAGQNAGSAYSQREAVPGSSETLQSLGDMSTFTPLSSVGGGGLQSMSGMDIYTPLSDQQGQYDGHPAWWPQ